MWWVGGWFVGTLLGPERAGPSQGVFVWGGGRCLVVGAGLDLIPLWAPEGAGQVWWGRVIGGRSYVENCTVDASIF